jgi:hypothetical protein
VPIPSMTDNPSRFEGESAIGYSYRTLRSTLGATSHFS